MINVRLIYKVLGSLLFLLAGVSAKIDNSVRLLPGGAVEKVGKRKTSSRTEPYLSIKRSMRAYLPQFRTL